MTWLRARTLATAGVLCLMGQGALLFLGARSGGLPGVLWPGLFLALTVGLAVVLALHARGFRQGAPYPVGRFLWQGLLTLAVGALLAVSAVGVIPGSRSTLDRRQDLPAETDRANLAQALDAQEHDLVTRLNQLEASDSGFMRALQPLPEEWLSRYRPEGGGDLAILVRRDGQAVAWTAGAVTPGNRDASDRVLRRVFSLADGRQVELQLTGTGRLAEAGRLATGIHRGALLLLLTGLVWAVVLLGTGRVMFGTAGLVAALWAGRWLLAGIDIFRWLPVAFPGRSQPAAPGSLFSLVDPAYFATPFAFGWFASTADALLTAGVLAVSVWYLMQKLGVLSSFDPGTGSVRRVRLLGQGPVSGLLFGLAAGLTLMMLRAFAGVLAENANARLIGQGASLDFLSFWGLHIVLMGVTLALIGLPVSLTSRRGWPARGALVQWVWGGALALIATLGVTLAWPSLGWSLRFLAGGLVLLLWGVLPALSSRPRFMRRFAWPAILLLAVVWNYGSLRAVHDQAERNWLRHKGRDIADSAAPWRTILLEEALESMRGQDRQEPAQVFGAEDVWRDEAAYRLWRQSSLADLGFPGAVEIIGEADISESFFATGFLRDFQYEVRDRSPWTVADGGPVPDGWTMIFQTETRQYPDGQEVVLAGEVVRANQRGWIRAEIPLRSQRIGSLLAALNVSAGPTATGYRPRSEVDRPVVLLRADREAWLDVGTFGFPTRPASQALAGLRDGKREFTHLDLGGRDYLGLWVSLPDLESQARGEGFLLGLQRPSPTETLLDLSRLMLLDLSLLFLLFLGIQLWRRLGLLGPTAAVAVEDPDGRLWRPGFQERFLAGYLLLGLLLLLVVGMSVDRVGYQQVRAEARQQTRAGLSLAVEQLHSLLVEQASSLAASDYINDLLDGQFSGQRTVGPLELRQAMVFGPEGNLLLDETLSDLTPAEAADLLEAGRRAPLLLIRDEDLYVATVIPIDLTGQFAGVPDSLAGDPGHGDTGTGGFFLYRQRFGADLLGGLADLARGQATLRFDGRPVLASDPGDIFAGRAPQLANPLMMAFLLDYPHGAHVFSSEARPFAFTGLQPIPAFGRAADGAFSLRDMPGVLSLDFPDREREFVQQRRDTILFLAGLANLILLTALLLALLMSWNLFRPLRLLMGATRSLAAGDFDAPLPEAGGDEVGRLTAAFGLMRSELQSARDRLAARERFLTTVLDRVTVGVAVLDDAEQVVALNPAGRHIMTDFMPQHSEETAVRRLAAEFRGLAAGRDHWGGELRGHEGHTLRGAMAPLDLPEDRTDTMLVFEDITEFLQTKKMAINAELARQVAHEIKNPLTPIQLSVQLLQQAWRDNHPDLDRIVTESVERVLSQVELLRTIASEFSLLGRPASQDLAPVDLVAMTREVVDSYAGADRATLQVSQADGPHTRVLAHADSLRKILGNLMQNSLDARREDTALGVDILWRRADRYLTLIWRDNGTGLPADVADRLFDPYFSTKSKGTGLGLAICRNLADGMGGAITLANRTDGPGAVAELSLPLADPESTSEEPA